MESTALMFAYGLDLFYTRLSPSKTFDLLPDDFPYALLVSLQGLELITYMHAVPGGSTNDQLKRDVQIRSLVGGTTSIDDHTNWRSLCGAGTDCGRHDRSFRSAQYSQQAGRTEEEVGIGRRSCDWVVT